MRLFTVLFGLIFSATTLAEVTIYAIDIPGLHEKSGGGIYDKPIADALVSTGQATVTVLPPARAENSFADCTNCCLSPANLSAEFYDYGSDVVQTEPMGTAQIFIFSQPNGAVISSLAALKGKKVGVRSGMPYGKSFDGAGLTTTATSKIENNIAKLESTRIDAMVAYVPDAYDAFSGLGKAPFPHAKDAPIAVHPDALVCRGVSQGFLDAFNSHVKK